ncbi:3244_t:CDS:2, partial [Racocetra fulgida]
LEAVVASCPKIGHEISNKRNRNAKIFDVIVESVWLNVAEYNTGRIPEMTKF